MENFAHLDDLRPKSPAWWRALDEATVDDTPIVRCRHTRTTKTCHRIHSYGPKCHPMREETYRCRDCGTILTYSSPR